MYKCKAFLNPVALPRKANGTEVGTLMVVTDSFDCGRWIDKILLHTYSGFVCLDNPSKTWGHDCSFNVRLLENGECVTLGVE
jgi:hypothetical protein